MYTIDDLKLLSNLFSSLGDIVSGSYNDISILIKQSNYNEVQFLKLLKDMNEVICNKILESPIKEFARENELTGESRYFFILYDNNFMVLQFCKSHFVRLLTEAPLYDMPLLLDIPVVGFISKWRLEIGK